MTAAAFVFGILFAATGLLLYALATGRNPVEAVARWIGNKLADVLFGKGGSPRW